ncbi:MAG: hypothetical protein IJU28_03240 [Clostridia bacterium]|nr:hypothetical protein [Clostridia bacterium]
MNEQYCPFCCAKLIGRNLRCQACGQSLPREILMNYGKSAQSELDSAFHSQFSQEASQSAFQSEEGYAYREMREAGEVSAERRCPYCFTLLETRSKTCPGCGHSLPEEFLVNPAAQTSGQAFEEVVIMPPVEEERIIDYPTTIEELKLYCEQHGMPLIKMRFFIGQDYKKPRAFGIYREGNTYIVYKNKANGQRAIRYQGPDEAFAVNELYQKLLSECHLRGIYPDGVPATAEGQGSAAPVDKSALRRKLIIVGIIIVAVILIFSMLRYERSTHGYYRVNDALYYRDNTRWYVYSDYDWMPYYGATYDWDDYYLGYSYEDDYGAYDVEDSSIWETNHPATDSSDYDSWDSFDTDWDSDW